MRKMLFPLFAFVIFASCGQDKKAAESTDAIVKSSATPATEKKMQSEFADPRYTDMGKQMMQEFESGNIDAYVEHFADNAVYQWSSGDSLTGKQAIREYWKNRRANVVTELDLSNDIWLPIKVNQPQRGPDVPGVWLISWQQVNATYKGGKKLQFWTHTDYHFNAEDKIDRCVQYIDRAPINAAIGMK